MKRFLLLTLTVLTMLYGVGCSKNTSSQVNLSDWDDVAKGAKGTTVNFYGWGGSENTNNWIDTVLAKEVKEKYDITLKRVPMNIDEILNKLLAEKQAGSKKGTIDVIWINGENFYTAKKNGLLYGPFTNALPNFKNNVDNDSVEVTHDFGFPTEGYEAPFGKAQVVMLHDSEKTPSVFKDHKELLEFAKKNPGKFTYPAPPDFTGSAFVRNLIYDIVGYEKLAAVKADETEVLKVIQPALDYFNELEPYLWNKGESYPATIAQVDSMYADGQLLTTMSYNPYGATSRINNGEFPKATKSFILDKGTIGNTHFVAIAENSDNKAGAMAVINEILSAKTQSAKYDPEMWGDLPVLNYNNLSDNDKKLFDNIKLAEDVLPQSTLLKHRVPEVSAELVPIIEKLWIENVAKGN